MGLAFISFSAEINASTTETLIGTAAELCNKGIDKLTILFSTPGGDVMNGINLYNFLRALPLELTMHNVGNVDSIGNAIFLAGKQRYACPHSTFMFHGVGYDILNPIRLEQKTLNEYRDGIMANQKRIGSVIRENTTGLTDSDIDGLFLEAKTKDADFALNKGFIHEIRDINIPVGTPIIPLIFQR